MSAFELAAAAIKESGKDPKLEEIKKISNDEKLSLYGLFKQATEGDNKAGAPWAVQL